MSDIEYVIENWVKVSAREPETMDIFRRAYTTATGSVITKAKCNKCLRKAFNQIRQYQINNG
jgi:hypothetical protein